jgi:hypothetical protein
MSEVNLREKFGGAFTAMRLDSEDEWLETLGVRLEVDRDPLAEMFDNEDEQPPEVGRELVVLTLTPLPDPLAQRGPDIAPIEPVTIMFERRVFDEAYDVAAEEFEQD